MQIVLPLTRLIFLMRTILFRKSQGSYKNEGCPNVHWKIRNYILPEVFLEPTKKAMQSEFTNGYKKS